jgi:hypothetical protein
MQIHRLVLVCVVLLSPCLARAQELPLNEKAFADKARQLRGETRGTERLRAAHTLYGGHRLTSQQVKQIAALLPDDQARLEFAAAVYPRVLDRENFYEVYDAFTSLSKVMRLHDRTLGQRGPVGPVVVAPLPPPTVTAADLEEFLKALRKEPFEDNKKRLAKQIIAGSRAPFLASQIKEIIALFPFEDGKLEIAKYAYDFTLDHEKYFVLNEAFAFPSTREKLARFLEDKNPRKH